MYRVYNIPLSFSIAHFRPAVLLFAEVGVSDSDPLSEFLNSVAYNSLRLLLILILYFAHRHRGDMGDLISLAAGGGPFDPV